MLGKASMCSGFHFIKIPLGPCRRMVGEKKNSTRDSHIIKRLFKRGLIAKNRVATKDIRGSKIRFKKHLEDKIIMISND